MPVPSKPFTFTNGPGNLIDATQVNSDFDTLYALLNAQLDKTNMLPAFAKDNVEPAFSIWKPIAFGAIANWSPTATNQPISTVGLLPSAVPFYLDPAQFAAGSRTTKYRIRLALYTNQVAPGVNITAFLGALTMTPGASGSDNSFAFASAPVTAALTTPAASSSLHAEGAATTPPAAGHVGLAVVASGTAAVGSRVDAGVFLEYQEI